MPPLRGWAIGLIYPHFDMRSFNDGDQEGTLISRIPDYYSLVFPVPLLVGAGALS
jgi:hypothetical protein